MKKQSSLNCMTFEEIAIELGINRRRAEQIYYAAIRKISDKMDKQVLKDLISLQDKYGNN